MKGNKWVITLFHILLHIELFMDVGQNFMLTSSE